MIDLIDILIKNIPKYNTYKKFKFNKFKDVKIIHKKSSLEQGISVWAFLSSSFGSGFCTEILLVPGRVLVNRRTSLPRSIWIRHNDMGMEHGTLKKSSHLSNVCHSLPHPQVHWDGHSLSCGLSPQVDCCPLRSPF